MPACGQGGRNYRLGGMPNQTFTPHHWDIPPHRRQLCRLAFFLGARGSSPLGAPALQPPLTDTPKGGRPPFRGRPPAAFLGDDPRVITRCKRHGAEQGARSRARRAARTWRGLGERFVTRASISRVGRPAHRAVASPRPQPKGVPRDVIFCFKMAHGGCQPTSSALSRAHPRHGGPLPA